MSHVWKSRAPDLQIWLSVRFGICGYSGNGTPADAEALPVITNQLIFALVYLLMHIDGVQQILSFDLCCDFMQIPVHLWWRRMHCRCWFIHYGKCLEKYFQAAVMPSEWFILYLCCIYAAVYVGWCNVSCRTFFSAKEVCQAKYMLWCMRILVFSSAFSRWMYHAELKKNYCILG